MTALDRAIEVVGSAATLASKLGIAHNTPLMWKRRKSVPAKYCPAIERAVRAAVAEKGGELVTCEQLRPDVAWEVLRLQAAPQVAQEG